MTVDVNEIIQALRNYIQTLTGLDRVYAYIPYSVNDADLPCAFISVDNGSYRQYTADTKSKERVFEVTFLWFKWIQGATGDGEAFRRAYVMHSRLERQLLVPFNLLVPDAITSVPSSITFTALGDNGIKPRPFYQSGVYLMTTVRLQTVALETEL